MAVVTAQSRTDVLGRIYAQTVDALMPNIEQAAYGSFATFDTLIGSPGVKRMQAGGPRVQQSIVLTSPDRAEALPKYGTMDVAVSNTKTAMLASIRPYGSTFTIDQTEIEEVRPDEAVESIVETEAREALWDLKKRLNRDCWDDAATNTDRIIGFEEMISEAPTTGTYLGISRSSNATWRSNQRDNDTNGTLLTLIADCRLIMSLCTYGTDKPNLIFASRDTRDLFESRLVVTLRTDPVVNRQRGGTVSGDPSVEDLFYRGARLVTDDDAQQYGTGSLNLVFVNTKYIRFTVREGADFKTFERERDKNQMVWTWAIRWAGALWCSNLRYQGVIWNITSAES